MYINKLIAVQLLLLSSDYDSLKYWVIQQNMLLQKKNNLVFNRIFAKRTKYVLSKINKICVNNYDLNMK